MAGSLGLGVTPIQGDGVHLSLEGAGGYVREELTADETDSFASLAALARGHWAPNRRVSLDTEVEWIANLEDSDDRLFHADISLTTQIWGPLQSSFTYLLSHASQPAPVFDPFAPPQASATPAPRTLSVLTFQFGLSF